MDKIKLSYKKWATFIFLLAIYIFFKTDLFYSLQANNVIKVALCTMGKKENLYAREFIEYYMHLGVDHMFIYDNNEPFTEKIEDVLEDKYKKKITFYQTHNSNIIYQKDAFTDCYKNNLKKYDWFIMVDMDEYLYIVNNTLKRYLNSKIFDKCDFIKIHWANAKDNDLLYYDKRPLFQRFKKPYIKSIYIKSIIRGDIPNLVYRVHSPSISPIKNVTCTNEGNIINYGKMNFIAINKINTNRAYFIHFRFKSTEEFINKYKRGYNIWFGNNINKFLQVIIASYFKENQLTLKKIDYIERELKLNLSSYRNKINSTTKFTNKFQVIE